MANRRLLLTGYDVASAARLRRALHIASAFSLGGQLSLHECWVTAGERERLRTGLDEALRMQADRWALFDLGETPLSRAFGRGRPASDPAFFLFGFGG